MIPWNHWPQYEGPLPKRRGGDYFFRRSGTLLCGLCGRQYVEHPRDFTQVDEGYPEPWLRVLCSGDRVKL